MRNSYLLITALAYIEENLSDALFLTDVAAACHCSLSGLQRIFKAVFSYSLKEYIIKRRLSRAARELISGGESITDIALKYQYGSPEAFSRAFARVFNDTPSLYRKKYRILEIFPRLTVEFEQEGKIAMKKVDISEFYDLLKELRGSYMLCADIRHFDQVNRTYGIAVGDAVLSEAAKRIEGCLGDEMTVLRVGNDEYLALTGLHDRAAAEKLAARITDHNGEEVDVKGVKIPLALRVAVAQLPEETALFKELLQRFEQAVDSLRESER